MKTNKEDASQRLQDLIKEIAKENATTICASSAADTAAPQGRDNILPFSVQGRDLVAREFIPAGKGLMKIPRHYQLWNTDALADSFVQEHLYTAKHAASQKLVDHRAYFAAYLALRVAKLQKMTVHDRRQQQSPLDLYLLYLPTAADYAHHPVLQDLNDLAATFDPQYSLTYTLIQRRQEEWRSEYAAFCTESSDFAAQIGQTDYLVARINLSSRAFSAGHDWTVLHRHEMSAHLQRADLDLYDRVVNYNVQRDGIQVLVPILDAHNHHPAANVEFTLDANDSLSFRFSACKDIAANAELFINYGGRVDPWLYATYGFVNADGSGLPGINLAVLHTLHHALVDIPLRPQLCGAEEDDNEKCAQWQFYQRKLGQPQREDLQRYLTLILPSSKVGESKEGLVTNRLENGEPPSSFQQWKLEALQGIANDPSYWVVALPPQNPHAPLPHRSTNPYPGYRSGAEGRSLDVEKDLALPHGNFVCKDSCFPAALERMIETALVTCRLLALTEHDDFERYKAKLPSALAASPWTKNPVAAVPPQALENRAHQCLLRLVEIALDRRSSSSSSSSFEFGGAASNDDDVVKSLVLASENYGLRLAQAYAQNYLATATRYA